MVESVVRSYCKINTDFSSSASLMTDSGVWEPSPISSCPVLIALSQIWIVPSGIPNSLGTLAPPISFKF